MREIYPLFSQPIYVNTENADKEFTEALEYCKTIKYIVNSGGNLASLDRNILDNPEFAEIKQIALDAIDHYTKNVMCWDSNEFYLTQSWANVNSKDTRHAMHYHLNSVVSGVFYLQTLEHDSITFHSDTKPMIDIKRSNFNMWNSGSWEVPIRQNTVVVFPSMVTHSVNVNNTDTNRISIAFNTFVRGKLGEEESLTLLDLK